MFNQKKQPPIKSLIASGTVIEGNVSFSEGLRVDGCIHGNLVASRDSPSLLVISETAVIAGQVSADHVIVNGAIAGPVIAEGLLELQPKARIEGDVAYKALEMHQGAVISGLLRPLGSNGQSSAGTVNAALKAPEQSKPKIPEPAAASAVKGD